TPGEPQVEVRGRPDPQIGAEEVACFGAGAGIGRRRRTEGRQDQQRQPHQAGREEAASHRRKTIPNRCYRRRQHRGSMSELAENFQTAPLGEVDPEIAAVLDGELRRQQRTLEMIASENFVPQAVLEAVGSVLTNKYAEGLPGRRYYGGCEEVDVAE